jgi:hypothetical protein
MRSLFVSSCSFITENSQCNLDFFSLCEFFLVNSKVWHLKFGIHNSVKFLYIHKGHSEMVCTGPAVVADNKL